ncbi:SH3 domain-containing protein [Roseicitreum antarcticum]|uniref:Uncharacterized protein n=1 Tax=Roseicitreum antarcticum TaxID=564137 RepID=A0A1H2RDM2_9RHOB|nr:SH3 domain-containing protein [Roseicitreum antarcticum]SDW17507.1 hypothetical protein SAMN04488238_101278 [Roseicitreum antarcticum]
MSRVWALVLALWLVPSTLLADGFPALYSVTGVPSDDVLNVRAFPDADASLLGYLEPGATGVEVVGLSETGRWGQVNMVERAGWVSMHYMKRDAGPDWFSGAAPLSCLGTEPFWSFDAALPGAGVTFSTPDGQFALQTRPDALPGTAFARTLALPLRGGAEGIAVVRAQSCFDNMSDRAYGLSVLLYFTDTAAGYSGCCRLHGG